MNSERRIHLLFAAYVAAVFSFIGLAVLLERAGLSRTMLGAICFLTSIAGYMLIGDLETVKLAVQKNAPREFAWTCAFGIVMTVLWIYVEILRIAMIFASDR